MTVLNCRNTSTLFASIEEAYGISQRELESSFIKLYHSSEENGGYVEPENLLKLLGDNSDLEQRFNATYYFHFTRISPNTNLEKLLPVRQAINFLWESLFSLVEGRCSVESWSQFKIGMDTDYDGQIMRVDEYRRRLKGHQYHDGPFGFMVIECALNSQMTHYFQLPEIIEAICDMAKLQLNLPLKKLYMENTKPCIVTFSSKPSTLDELKHALDYLYCATVDINLPTLAYSFSGNGVAQPVVSIDFYD